MASTISVTFYHAYRSRYGYGSVRITQIPAQIWIGYEGDGYNYRSTKRLYHYSSEEEKQNKSLPVPLILPTEKTYLT